MTFRFAVFLLLFAAAPAGAQSVADYYHAAAQSYIGGQNAEAERAAEAGLAIDPTNEKLQALLEKIRERNPQNGGGEQEQEDADQQEQGEGEQQQDAEGGEQEESETEGEQQPQDEQDQQQAGEQQPEEPSQQQPQDEQQGDAGAEGEQDPSDPQGGGDQFGEFEVEPGQMSRAEAERILRAIESDELELLREVQRRRARPRYVEKDW